MEVGPARRGQGLHAGQLALAWVLAAGSDVVPIPGTKRRAYLEENVAALDVELSAEDLAMIDDRRRGGGRSLRRHVPRQPVGATGRAPPP